MDSRCPMCQLEKYTTEYVLEYNKEDTKINFNDERGKEWGEIVETYRKNRENRSINNIRGEQNTLVE